MARHRHRIYKKFWNRKSQPQQLRQFWENHLKNDSIKLRINSETKALEKNKLFWFTWHEEETTQADYSNLLEKDPLFHLYASSKCIQSVHSHVQMLYIYNYTACLYCWLSHRGHILRLIRFMYATALTHRWLAVQDWRQISVDLLLLISLFCEMYYTMQNTGCIRNRLLQKNISFSDFCFVYRRAFIDIEDANYLGVTKSIYRMILILLFVKLSLSVNNWFFRTQELMNFFWSL